MLSASGMRAAVAALTAATLAHAASWQLVWSDDFSGDTLNASVWSVWDNRTHGTTEKALYNADEVSVSGGNLVIRTRYNPTMYGTKLYNFTTGWVTTAEKLNFTYGRFEFDAKLPSALANCSWPALWLVDDIAHCWPTGGEIDIMEEWGAGSATSQAFGTYHWGKGCSVDQWDHYHAAYPNASRGQAPIDFSTGYHTFAAEWDASSITWSVDNVSYITRTAGDPPSLFVPSWPLFIIINTAVSPSGAACDRAGLPTPDNYPVYFYVDAVRVYQQQ